MQPQIDDLLIDTFTREEPSYEADVTDHPVEKGGDVTDNVRPKPNMLTVDGVISESPIGAAATASSVLASPTANARARLKEIFDAKQPIGVTTTTEVWTQMVMQSLTIPVDASTGLSLTFTAKFKQVIIVETQRTQVRVAVPSHGKEQNLGNLAADKKDLAKPLLDAIDKERDNFRRYKKGTPEYETAKALDALRGGNMADTPVNVNPMDHVLGNDIPPGTVR